MNDEMINTFKTLDIFDMLMEYPTAPKSFKDLEAFEESCIKEGFVPLAEFIDEWRVAIQYYIDREHNDSDEFYL